MCSGYVEDMFSGLKSKHPLHGRPQYPLQHLFEVEGSHLFARSRGIIRSVCVCVCVFVCA